MLLSRLTTSWGSWQRSKQSLCFSTSSLRGQSGLLPVGHISIQQHYVKGLVLYNAVSRKKPRNLFCWLGLWLMSICKSANAKCDHSAWHLFTYAKGKRRLWHEGQLWVGVCFSLFYNIAVCKHIMAEGKNTTMYDFIIWIRTKQTNYRCENILTCDSQNNASFLPLIPCKCSCVWMYELTWGPLLQFDVPLVRELVLTREAWPLLAEVLIKIKNNNNYYYYLILIWFDWSLFWTYKK